MSNQTPLLNLKYQLYGVPRKSCQRGQTILVILKSTLAIQLIWNLEHILTMELNLKKYHLFQRNGDIKFSVFVSRIFSSESVYVKTSKSLRLKQREQIVNLPKSFKIQT